MTTYDMKSASQRALTMLAKSQPYTGGLTLNLTDDSRYPEERLAARLIERRGLEPPVDVEALARSFATVTTKKFPIEIDGLCLDLDVRGKKPKIWIAEGLHRVRRRFTLAHEIGHIRIPWHTGTIVDEIDIPQSREKSKYREMEAEANRFAAELLMPTPWVMRTMERTRHPAELMKLIVEVADVSYPSALYKVRQLCPIGYVGATIRDDKVVWSGTTKGTRAKKPLIGCHLSDIESDVFEDPRIVRSSTEEYYWWRVKDENKTPPSPTEPWRQILDRMLLSIPESERPTTRSSVNAVIGSAFGYVRGSSNVDELYNSALKSCTNRHDRDANLRVIFGHDEFKSYLIARCYAQLAK